MKNTMLAAMLLVSLSGCSSSSSGGSDPVSKKDSPAFVAGVDNYEGRYIEILHGYDKYSRIPLTISLESKNESFQLSAEMGCNVIVGGVTIKNRRVVPDGNGVMIKGNVSCGSETRKAEIEVLNSISGKDIIMGNNEISFGAYRLIKEE